MPPDNVLFEMFTLLIVPAQVSIMIALRSGSLITFPVMVTTPSIVLSLAPDRSTNAIELTSKSPASDAVPVVVIVPLANVKFVTSKPSIPFRAMSWMFMLVNDGSGAGQRDAILADVLNCMAVSQFRCQ